MEEFKRDTDGLSEEDFSEVDRLIEYLKTLPKSEMFVSNPIRVEQMRFAAGMMKRVLRETGSKAKFECKQHEFNPTMGVVRIEGASLDILDIEGFSRAAEFASNTEIYPLSKNAVRMTFTFQGLAEPVK